MTEKYISSQGLLIQSVHLLLLIRLQAKKPILEILPIRTTFDCKQISTTTVGGLWIYELFSSGCFYNELL